MFETKKVYEQHELMTMEQAREFLGLSDTAIKIHAERGSIPCHKRWDAYYFSKQELIAYIMANPTGSES